MKYLAELVMRLGEVDRLTRHPDGERLESVTTHTVMLALTAYELARHEPDLDLEGVLLYALVHDLVEAYAGDTATLIELTDEQKLDKQAREGRALDRIVKQLETEGSDDVASALYDYEHLVDREACFVKAVDKLVPKLTHMLNDAAVLVAEGLRPDQLNARLENQRTELSEGYARYFPRLIELHDHYRQEVVARLEARLGREHGSDR